MKILWIVNIMMPEACQLLNLPISKVGGWLSGYQTAILNAHPDIELHIVQPGDRKADVRQGQTIHHIFPQRWIETGSSFASAKRSRLSAISNQLPTYFDSLKQDIQPDVIHIHGTEFAHSLVWIETCGCEHTMVSIQGLASVCARYYMGGLTQEDKKGCWSFNDWRFNRTLGKEQHRLSQRGELETQLLKKVEHIAGRTAWDKAHAQVLAPQAQYHTLQEVLREPFYNPANAWTLSKCQRHSIFVSQSHYPLKGLHQVLKALPYILKEYPDTQLYVVGEDRIDQHWRHRSTYVNVLRKIIYQNNLRRCVHFLGTLTAEKMIEQYQRANLYICPSSIENSSNSLCEAQIIGTPVIASYVGGLPDLVEQGTSGLLYRFEEVEMLAQYVCQLFADDQLAMILSNSGRTSALRRHDREAISNTLFKLYSWI